MRTLAADRRFALGGVVGPIAFVAAWAIGGFVADDYSPVEDAISELAAVGASTRLLMTTGFVAYGIGVGLFAVALRHALPGRAWLAAAVSALATLGVAATPLDHSAFVDDLHGVFAGTGYVALAALPLLARPYLSTPRARGASVVAAAVSGACLALTLTGDAHGLFQRVGLGAGDIWIVATAIALLARSALRATLPAAD
ncbi:MAG: DUF998 domain-containing protein [Actinomycetota bacterium]|nr:DUF998 domain-containing protein [Actinomycetota bacterium]